MDRMATAPISWGICEVPGWGIQLPVDRVLSEMAEIGFTATELGAEGYLPSDPAALRSVLKRHRLELLSAFVPLVVHDVAEAARSLDQATAMAELLRDGGATYFATAPVTSWDWKPRRPLSHDEWDQANLMFDLLGEISQAHGLTHVLHEHFGTIVETKEEIQRVLDHSNIGFVLDTAHLAVGGFDPVEFAKEHSDRVGLVHVKDANLAIAERLNDGELTLMEAVQAGLFPTVGRGDLDIDSVIAVLEGSGYAGWYVLEQDIAITGEEPAPGKGPIEHVRESVTYLRGLETGLAQVRSPASSRQAP